MKRWFALAALCFVVGCVAGAMFVIAAGCLDRATYGGP